MKYNVVSESILLLLQINISTIAGSRHVGPIKPRVEDWQRQLHLFSETLVRYTAISYHDELSLRHPRAGLTETNRYIILYVLSLFARMSGWHVNGTGCIWRVFSVLLTSRDSCLLRPRCSWQSINLGRKSWGKSTDYQTLCGLPLNQVNRMTHQSF